MQQSEENNFHRIYLTTSILIHWISIELWSWLTAHLKHSLLWRVLLFSVGLRSHDSLHVTRPTIGAGHQGARRCGQSVRHRSFVNLLFQSIKFLQPFGQWFIFLLQGFLLFLAFLGVVKFQAFLGNILEFLAIEFWERLDAVFINRLNKVQNFISLLQQTFHKRRFLNLYKTGKQP